MMDRILLLLLLLLLPAGIITSRFVSGELKVGSGMSPLQEKKLEVLFERVNSQTTDTKPKRNPINITSVVYASESGVLRVGGVVPDSKQFVWVYIAGTLHKEGKKTASGSSEPQSLTVSQPIAIKPTGTTANVNTGWIGANTSDTRISGWSNGSGLFGPLGTTSRKVMESTSPDPGTSVYVTYVIEVNQHQPTDLYAGQLVYNILPNY